MTVNEALAAMPGISMGDMKFGLERIRDFLGRAKNPQKNLRFVHIAGTNGKGSVAAMLAAVLKEAGYKTGLFTSPAVETFNEQFRINGVPVSDGEIADIIAFLKARAEAMPEQPTLYEYETAIAFEYFKRGGCDIVILETGLGGRLDATNVIDFPEAAVITAISRDHTKLLGETITQIAAEKAGIIKENIDVVRYTQSPELDAVIERKCAEQNARLHKTDFSEMRLISQSLDGQTVDFPGYAGLFLPLLGGHQRKNALTALETIAVLRQKGFEISDAAVYRGFKNVRWPARFEVICRAPAVILDGGHNPHGMRALANTLRIYFPEKKITFVTGVFADKAYPEMMDLIAPVADRFYTVLPDSPRGLEPEILAECLKQFGLPVMICGTVTDGLQKALAETKKDAVICVTGSLSIAGEARSFFGA